MAEKKTTGATKARATQATKRLRVTYVKSAIGYNVKQKQTIEALGLRRLPSPRRSAPHAWGRRGR